MFVLTGDSHSCVNLNVRCSSAVSLFLLETQTVGAQCAQVGEFTFATVAVYWFLWQSLRCQRWKISLCTQRTRWQWGIHADFPVYLFINRRFAPQLRLRGLFSPVSPPEVLDSGTSGTTSVTHAHACTVASASPCAYHEWVSLWGTVKARGRMKGGVEGSGDHGKTDPLLIGLVRESSGF